MKKIVSVLVILALVCGAVFAVDVNLQVRLASRLVSVDNLNADTPKTTLFDLGGISGRDNLGFSMSTANAGVKFVLQPDFASMLVGKDLTAATDPFKRINEMSAYVKFGALEFGAGKWQDGKYFAEQCKADGDNTNWSAAGDYAQKYKLGIITGGYGKEFDSLVNVSAGGTSNTNVAGYAEYVLKEVLPGALTFRGVLVEYSNDLSASDDDITWNSALGFMIAYNQPKVIKVNLDMQFIPEADASDKTAAVFGIYASPLMIANTTGVFGVTFANNAAAETKDLGIDLRARYTGVKGLALATAHNFSIKSLGEDASTKQLWNQVNVLYAVADWIDLTFNAQSDGKIDADGNFSTTLYFTLGPSFKSGEGMITTGVHFKVSNVGADADVATKFDIPCIFRVKM